jgi:hypothetical protein
MGNRAVITTRENFDNDGIGVYVHWNGGIESVTAFLEFCKRKGYRSLADDPEYGFARLVQVIANYFSDGFSVGVGKLSNLDCDNYDNGTYIVDGWDIVGREYEPYDDTWEPDEDELEEMINSINSCQPEGGRL